MFVSAGIVDDFFIHTHAYIYVCKHMLIILNYAMRIYFFFKIFYLFIHEREEET